MSSAVTPSSTRRLDQHDWQSKVVVSDDAAFPIDRAVAALEEVLEIPFARALAFCRLIERYGDFPVWRGTPEGAKHNAARLRARGLDARAA